MSRNTVLELPMLAVQPAPSPRLRGLWGAEVAVALLGGLCSLPGAAPKLGAEWRLEQSSLLPPGSSEEAAQPLVGSVLGFEAGWGGLGFRCMWGRKRGLGEDVMVGTSSGPDGGAVGAPGDGGRLS